MNNLTRAGIFALGLAVAFGAAVGVGRLVGPIGEPASHEAGGGHGPGDAHPGPSGVAAQLPGGLQVSEAGYRLEPVTPRLGTGAATEFAFRILGPDGAPVTRYTPTHDKELHLIVVRRDLSGFQHVHPTLGADGTWRIPLAVAGAGEYRVFADFRPQGRAEALTLGVDVPAAGPYEPRPLPGPARVAEVDGYRVELSGDLTPGAASAVTLRVSRDGRPVTDLEPYLGAYGHLVALRAGDLAYLHVHPDGVPGDGRTPAGPDVTFHAEVPSAGTYRLYLDFQHDGKVRTAEFTVTAGGATPPAGGSAAPPVQPAPPPGGGASPPPGHDDSHGHG